MITFVTYVVAIAGFLTSLATILTFLFKFHKWYMKQEKQDKDISNLKEEQRIICTGVLACLDGLEQLGCNHSVPRAKEKLEEHINNAAHK